MISVVLFTILVHLSHQAGTSCPDDQSAIAPCTCTGKTRWGDIGPHLNCAGKQPIDIDKMSKELSQYYNKVGASKTFNTLDLHNTAITELKENAFGDLKFGVISKLKNILSSM